MLNCVDKLLYAAPLPCRGGAVRELQTTSLKSYNL